MSSIKQALSGEVLVSDLGVERRKVLAAVARGGHSARTLFKSGPLRVTQVVIAPGGGIPDHEAGGSITVQPLQGRICFTAGATAYDLGPGQLLAIGPGIRHSVTSEEGATVLLTVGHGDRAGVPDAGAAVESAAQSDKRGSGRGPEAWLRGPLDGVPALLMPVAHALVQGCEDLQIAAGGLSEVELWTRPGGAASVGFHLRHIAGSLDRLFSYARGIPLTQDQITVMRQETAPDAPQASAEELLLSVSAAVQHALEVLRATPADSLLEPREVGRARLPSNVLGLLFHAAEHAQRHTGQVITTTRILRGLARRMP